jgi:Oxidoreductase-like protein, N-terminal
MCLNLSHLKIVSNYSTKVKNEKVSKKKEIKLPKKPVEPDPSECCNRGCENCVYIYYEKALKRWQEKVDKLKKKGA